MTQNAQTVHEVVINFRVHAPHATARDRVWLLGSLPELGEWNPARAMEAGQVDGEFRVWQATVRMPVESSFEWGWCSLTVDGRLKRWETMGRRARQISYFSGTLHTEWGDTTIEIFHQNMASAQLTTEKRTKRGHVMAVLGSSPPLGAWDPKKAVIAQEYPKRSGQWTATIFFDGGTLQEWNWVILDEATMEVKLLEKCATRFLSDTHGWIKLHVPWNRKEAAVDWATSEYVGGGDTYVGTVEMMKQRRARLMEIRRWEEAAEARRQGKQPFTMLASSSLQPRSPSPTFRPATPTDVTLSPILKQPTTPPAGTTPTMKSTSTETTSATTSPSRQTLRAPSFSSSIARPTPSLLSSDTGHSSGEDSVRSSERQALSPSRLKLPSFPDFKPLLKIKPYTDDHEDPKDNRTARQNKQYNAAIQPKITLAKVPASTVTSSGTQTDNPIDTSPRQAGKCKGQSKHCKNSDTSPQLSVGSKPSSTSRTAKCLPSFGELFHSPRGSKEKLSVNKGSEAKCSSTSTSTASGSTAPDSVRVLQVSPSGAKKSYYVNPVDMSTLGFKGDKPSAGEDKKKSLVSEPGKPGYSRPVKATDSNDAGKSPVAQRVRSHSPSYQSGQLSPSPGVENYMCHTVQGREAGEGELVPVASSSCGSSVGILYDPERPRVGSTRRLQKLQQMSEQREQARANDRMDSVRQREERNKSKFQQDQKFVLVTAGAYPRSPPGGSPTRVVKPRPEERTEEKSNIVIAPKP